MNAFDLILSLQRIIDAGHGDLPVYMIDGHNGTSERIDSGFHHRTVEDGDDGDLAELDEGTEYVGIMVG